MITGWSRYLRYTFPVPTLEDRARLEQYIGHKLPEHYWELILEHQGEIPNPAFVILNTGATERCGVFLHVFDPMSLTDPSALRVRNYAVFRRYASMRGDYPEDVVPFSDDTAGNYMAFDFRSGGEPSIVFVDHNVQGEAGLTPIAPNFEAFLNMLVPDPED